MMSPTPIKLAPSILAADFARLGQQVAEADRAGANRIHVDVMDGHFVPQLSMGPPVVKSLRPLTKLPLEVHLMVNHPDQYFDDFVAAGADAFIVHWEGNDNLHRTIEHVRRLHKRVGVAINPATPATVLEETVQLVDQILVMTVDPGLGGQPFLESTLPKIQRVRQMAERLNPGCDVELDGGIDHLTASRGVGAGANVLVAGSSIFGNPLGVAKAMDLLRASLTA